MTNDEYVLQCIRGARILFKNGFPTHQTRLPREINMTKEQSDFVDKKLITLEANGTLKPLTNLMKMAGCQIFLRFPKNRDHGA